MSKKTTIPNGPFAPFLCARAARNVTDLYLSCRRAQTPVALRDQPFTLLESIGGQRLCRELRLQQKNAEEPKYYSRLEVKQSQDPIKRSEAIYTLRMFAFAPEDATLNCAFLTLSTGLHAVGQVDRRHQPSMKGSVTTLRYRTWGETLFSFLPCEGRRAGGSCSLGEGVY